MISRLRIQRFKCFEDQEIAFGKLTLLVGANATGKSTVIQAVLLLKQAFSTEGSFKGGLLLNGKLISIGTAKDALYSKSQENSIAFTSWINSNETPLALKYAYQRGEPDVKTLTSMLPAPELTSTFFHKDFTYLSAERLGPRLLYAMSDVSRAKMTVGIRGEFTAHCLAEFGNQAIANANLAFPRTDNLLFNYQTQLWMRQIVSELDIEIQPISQADQVRIGLRNQGNTDYWRPTNTGFGISYTLPIVVAALMSKPDSVLIVENPEAHLHPAAQSEMGQFLARVAATGVQVIVETHSDHILNGMRLAVKRKLLLPDDVSIQFFVRGEKDTGNQVLAPKIDADGRIDLWPEGFFDQIEKDLLELM